MKDTQNTNYIFTPTVSEGFLRVASTARMIAKEKNVIVEYDFNNTKILVNANTNIFKLFSNYKKVLNTELGSLAKKPSIYEIDIYGIFQKRLEFINKQFNQTSQQTITEAIDKYYREVLGNINQGNEHEGLPLIPEI